MDIKSKFNLGDKVYQINTKRESVKETCKFCDGAGKIKACNEELVWCSNCHSDGYINKSYYTAWFVDATPLTIGQIRITVGYNPEEQYMCRETGLGSGTLHSLDKMFATIEEAQAACNKKNEMVGTK